VFGGVGLAAIARLTAHQWREVNGDRGFEALRPFAARRPFAAAPPSSAPDA
jgi:hypothetical protein